MVEYTEEEKEREVEIVQAPSSESKPLVVLDGMNVAIRYGESLNETRYHNCIDV